MYIKYLPYGERALPGVRHEVSGLAETHSGIHLTPGKEYLVYAVEFTLVHADEDIWPSSLVYYVCDDVYSFYPVWYPAEFFSLSGNSIPRAWVFAQWISVKSVTAGLYAEDWAKDRYFYDRLTDSEPEAMALWWHIKETIEQQSI